MVSAELIYTSNKVTRGNDFRLSNIKIFFWRSLNVNFAFSELSLGAAAVRISTFTKFALQ